MKMIRCRTCGTENLEGSQYCDECGSAIQAGRPDIPNFQPPQLSDPSVFSSGSVTSVGIPPVVEDEGATESDPEAESSNPAAGAFHAALIIERGESIGKRFNLSTEESHIGRWDADNGIFPDVDLDIHDPEAKVSRRHARIMRQNGKYMIEDLGSTNGTFVNRGRRLIPGEAHILSDGDEIIVGKTFLRFYVND